jgi:anti-sigma B factor antagonist
VNGGPGFSVDVRREGARTIVAPSGEIDLGSAGQLRSALARVREDGPLVLDLCEVTFMDSVGLGLIIEEHRRAEREGTDFRLRRGPERVQRLFELTGLQARLRWDEDGLAA